MDVAEARTWVDAWGITASFPHARGGMVRGYADAKNWSICVFVGDDEAAPERRHLAYMIAHEAAHVVSGHTLDNLEPGGAEQEAIAASCGLRFAAIIGDKLPIGRAAWEGELVRDGGGREAVKVGREIANLLLSCRLSNLRSVVGACAAGVTRPLR